MTAHTIINSLFDLWNEALISGDAENVATLYASDAILLPTVSNQVRHNTTEIADYFAHFLLSKPTGKILESNVRVFGDHAINSGIYEFTLTPEDKPTSVIQARFTFVYRKTGDDWRIVEHHSSKMPE
jgi:uncharacterized protein (TIGR02246 family)